MRVFALAAVCLTLLGAASAADAATPVKGTAPAHLHGFLLRADEPADNSFPRTPSFAWNPVAGAVRYQFQLSTSSSFRDSGLLYTAANLAPRALAHHAWYRERFPGYPPRRRALIPFVL